MNANVVYSEFDLRRIGFMFSGETVHAISDAVGTAEETMETKTVTKNKRGVVDKTRTKGTGNGEIKFSMHMPYETYLKAYSMNLDTLIEGVHAYGQNSVHKTFSITEDVYDEDEVEKLKAYPNCIISDGVARKVENGSEEVAEIELTVAVMPDKYGNGVYEAIKSEIPENVAVKWMEEFTPELVQATIQA